MVPPELLDADARAGHAALRQIADAVAAMPDDDGRAAQRRAERVLQLGVCAVRPRAGAAHAVLLQRAHLLLQALGIRRQHVAHERLRAPRLGVDALGGGHDQQHARGYQPRDDRRRLVVVHALVHLAALPAQRGQLPLAVLLVGDGVVVVDDRDRALLLRPQEQAADVLALLRIVEVLVLNEHLAHGILLPDEVPVLLHQDGLALRGVVRLGVHAVAGQLMPGAADVVEPPDLRRAGGHPDHARAQLAPQPGKDVVVDVGVLAADERHRADLADEVKVVLHNRNLLALGIRWAAAQTCLRDFIPQTPFFASRCMTTECLMMRLFVIPLPRGDLERAVRLLQQHDARQLMREGHRRKGQLQLRAAHHLLRQPQRAADDEHHAPTCVNQLRQL